MLLLPRRWAHRLPNEDALLLGSGESPDLVTQWEKDLAEFTGAPHVVAVSSGRRGMRLIFEYLKLPPGEVIVPAYTLGDLVPLIEDLGHRAVPADIDPDTMNVTVASAAARINENTRALLCLHAFGAPAPLEGLAALCAERGIPMIEDGAHALGATYNGKAAGTFGIAGFYSFEPTKPVNTYGGGAVVTADPALAAHVRGALEGLPLGIESAKKKATACVKEQRLMRTGIAWPILGLFATPPLKRLLEPIYRGAQSVPASNTRYAPGQAALGIEKLRTLDDRIAARARAIARYRDNLPPAVQFQEILPGAASTWYFAVAVLPRPAGPVRRAMLLRGVDAAVDDEIADDTAAMLGWNDCPNAARLAAHAVALPLFDGITDAQVVRAAKALAASL